MDGGWTNMGKVFNWRRVRYTGYSGPRAGVGGIFGLQVIRVQPFYIGRLMEP